MKALDYSKKVTLPNGSTYTPTVNGIIHAFSYGTSSSHYGYVILKVNSQVISEFYYYDVNNSHTPLFPVAKGQPIIATYTSSTSQAEFIPYK